MAVNRAGFIARWFARRARPAPPEAAGADEAAVAEAPHAEPRTATENPPPAPADEPTPAAARPAAAGDIPEHEAPAAEATAAEATAAEATAAEAEATLSETAVADAVEAESAGPTEPEADAPGDAAAGHADPESRPESEPEPDADADAGAEAADILPEDSAPSSADAPAPSAGPAPTPRDHKVITLVSLAEHAGAKTLAAALGRRTEGKGWRFRTAGPGLARAAFAGMLGDTDALVLVSPADPEVTTVLGEKLRWLEANNRKGMPARTLVVVNLGAADGAALQLPADLDRPLVLLPHDPSLGIPATPARAPRRATRRALDQLVDELSTILEEN
ncbi:hypothetical protein ACIPVK_17355 [Paeniglutamicibacter sp. MACA_103]|uniref:hypothetical protein n=1 Tax=Paeniglutamicibacter sp. MACA_103 TaxID=3377337 RepID=UPI0038949AFD